MTSLFQDSFFLGESLTGCFAVRFSEDRDTPLLSILLLCLLSGFDTRPLPGLECTLLTAACLALLEWMGLAVLALTARGIFFVEGGQVRMRANYSKNKSSDGLR